MPGPNPLIMWLAYMESHITNWLLRQPVFHRGVEAIHRQVHRLRHGKPPEEMGGMNIDEPGRNGQLFKHFKEELRDQFRDLTGRGGRGKTPPKR